MKKSSLFAAWAAAMLGLLGVKPTDSSSDSIAPRVTDSKLPDAHSLSAGPSPFIPSALNTTSNDTGIMTEAQTKQLNQTLDAYASTVKRVNATLDEALSNTNLSTEDMAKIRAQAERDLQAANNQVISECRIAANLVVDASGTTSTPGGADDLYYRANKNLAKLVLNILPDSVPAMYRQFSIYTGGTTEYTINHVALENTMNALVYQGGGTHLHLAFNDLAVALETGKITPSANLPLVTIIFTDGQIQRVAEFRQALARFRAAGGGHESIMVFLTEGQSGIDESIIRPELTSKDKMFSFREPNAFQKATDAMLGALLERCSQNTNAPVVGPQATQTPVGTPTPSFVPTMSPEEQKQCEAELLCFCMATAFIFCVPGVRFEAKKKEVETKDPAADVEAGVATRTPTTFGTGKPVGRVVREAGPVTSNKKTFANAFENEPGGATWATSGIYTHTNVKPEYAEHAPNWISPGFGAEEIKQPPVTKAKDNDWAIEPMLGLWPIVLLNFVDRLVTGKAHLGELDVVRPKNFVRLYNLAGGCFEKLQELRARQQSKQAEKTANRYSITPPSSADSGNPIFYIERAASRLPTLPPNKPPSGPGT